MEPRRIRSQRRFALGAKAGSLLAAFAVAACWTGGARAHDASSAASGYRHDVAPPPAWPGPFADRGVATAWTRPIPVPAPSDPNSAAWVHALFAPPGDTPSKGRAVSYAGRLQFCTREAYAAFHFVSGGRRAVGSRGCSLGDSGASLVFATRADPAYTLKCYEFGSGCNAEGETIRIPRDATANANSDHHLAIIDEAAARECDVWEAGWYAPDASTGFVGPPGILAIGNGGCGSLRGDGSGPQWQATGASVPLSAGLLRAVDVLGPSGDGTDGRIAHALYATIRCAARDYRYPASRSDGATPGCAPEGARFFLTAAGLAKFARARPPVPHWQMTIVRAYHEYGLIVSDHGGDDFGLLLEDDAGSLLYGKPAPWSQTFIAFAKDDPLTTHAKIDLTPANDVYHINLAVPPNLAESDWVFAAACVNRGTCR